MLPSPVKLSITLSDISNEDMFEDKILPNTTSVIAGAAENTNTESGAIPVSYTHLTLPTKRIV